MILGIDSSAVTAGCALYDDGRIIAEQFLNNGHTHSETMLPMVESMLKNAGITLAMVDSIAVTAGPGSFTGLRIGIAAVKGMAVGAKKPCIAVSALEAIAYNFVGFDCVVCACMDARCGQVYNALFKAEGGAVSRLCEDRAVRAEELSSELAGLKEKIVFAGDGAVLMDNFTEHIYELAPYPLRYQRGSGVCLAAAGKAAVSAAALMPVYLRLPQAERERLARESSDKS